MTLIQKGLAVVVILLFLSSPLLPMIPAETHDAPQKEPYDEYLSRSYYNRYTPFESTGDDAEALTSPMQVTDLLVSGAGNENRMLASNGGLMDSAWPMFGRNVRHTGQSPYSTASNQGGVKWIVQTQFGFDSSPVIASDGTIYVGNWGLYAINPNGTIKWQAHTETAAAAPAIASDGTIYIGSYNRHLYAFNPDGTRKWTFNAEALLWSSPAIADDGTIYFGAVGPGNVGRVYALYPNGTKRWHYDTGFWSYSHPAIGEDGTVYISSNDGYLYALYPNGTLQWRFSGGDIMGSPAIGEDGTIYAPCHNKHLFAIHPNGTEKWRGFIERWSGFTPSIAADGTIYVGGRNLYAFYPNGTHKWTYVMDRFHHVTSSTLAISAEGTIYAGFSNETGASAYFIAVNPDGTEQWREYVSNEWVRSAPAIAEDGTIYVGTTWLPAQNKGHFYAFHGQRFGDLAIQKPVQGKLYINDTERCSTLQGRTVCIGPITIQATHTTPDNVTKVEFYLDGKKQTEILTPPYQWTYNRFSFKKHTITVIATNAIGITRSDSITIWKFF